MSMRCYHQFKGWLCKTSQVSSYIFELTLSTIHSTELISSFQASMEVVLINMQAIDEFNRVQTYLLTLLSLDGLHSDEGSKE